MATTLSVGYQALLRVVETFSDGASDDNTVTFDMSQPSGDAGTLTASSTVPATKHARFDLTLSSGSGSINLAALTGVNGDETVVGTGLKLQLLLLYNPSTNANKITVAKGGSNGYGLTAAGDAWTAVLDPGQWRLFYMNDSAPDVASGARVLDVTGTGSQVLKVHAVLG